MKQSDVLSIVERCERHFGSAATTRQLPRRDVLRAVSDGLVESIGNVVLCDDDGWTKQPERYGEGFVLTDAGHAALAAAKENP